MLTLLANEMNSADILEELSACALHESPSVARSAIAAVGTIAMKIESTSGYAIRMLLSFLNLRFDNQVTQTLMTMKDLMRAYPYLSLEFVPFIKKSLDTVHDPDGRSAIIWMVGEYGERI